MGSYKYKVKGKSGQMLNGVITADDQRSAIGRLQEMGYFILEIHEVRERSAKKWNPMYLFIRWLVNPIFSGATAYELAIFFRQFATMVKSGMNVLQSLSSLRNQGGSRRLRKIAAESVPFVQAGGKLSDAFARYPWMFPELHISLIRAAEEGGTLDSMLVRIAEYLEREHGIRQKLRLATLYPKLLILAVILIPNLHLLLLNGFKPYFKATIVVLIPVLVGLLVLWVAYRLLYQIPAFRYGIDVVKLAIPKVGKMVKMLAMSKFYRVLGAMYAAGAPLSRGITHAANASGNWYLTTRLRTAVPAVERGAPLTEALKSTGVLPSMAADMLATGEQTGNVDEMLEKAAEYTESEAETATVQSTIIVGVLMLLIVAGYIGFKVVEFWTGHYANLMDQ